MHLTKKEKNRLIPELWKNTYPSGQKFGNTVLNTILGFAHWNNPADREGLYIPGFYRGKKALFLIGPSKRGGS